VRAWYNKSFALYNLTKWEEAIRCCEEVIKLTHSKATRIWDRQRLIKPLADRLIKNTALTFLDLNEIDIGDEEAKGLGEGLSKNTTLRSLNLCGNLISDEGVKALAEGLTHNMTLTSLKLSENQISDEGAKALADALAKNTTLIELSLSCTCIEDALCRQIDSLIERNQQYLEKFQAEACRQLEVARLMLFQNTSADSESSAYLSLPLELKEKIVNHAMEQLEVFTEEQQKLIISYAMRRIAPVADKLSFFKVTKCDRLMKPLILEDSSETNEPPAKRARIESSCSRY
jgi:hypothetical protein